MKLTTEQIASVTLGAERVTNEKGGTGFHRFTAEQEEIYRLYRDDFYQKTFCSSGVKLSFKTDSRTLGLNADVYKHSTRSYISFDVFVNGKCIGNIDNFSHVEIPAEYATLTFEGGNFEKTFELGEGEKAVEIYLPWSCLTVINELALEDGASLVPVRPAKRMITFGDSITQGYDALRPSNRYAAKLANFLSAEERCKGIGGEGFFPELARSKDDGYDPDYISVAYGTNDWSHAVSREELTARCLEFYTALRETYPRAKIFAISPIWRKDEGKYSAFGTFDEMQKLIAEIAESLPEVYFIEGYNAVPHDESYFADLYLHPNDRGFECYAEKVCAQIKKYV